MMAADSQLSVNHVDLSRRAVDEPRRLRILLRSDHNYFLRYPIPNRIKVSPDSSPEALLQQLDGLSNWPALKNPYPEFPKTDYPPKRPCELPLDLLCAAYSKNGALEWLGDAIIGAAALLCIYRFSRDPDYRALRTPNIIAALVGRPFLGHLALLYGLQLHDYILPSDGSMPSMERMCDIFESYVGAAVDIWGFLKTIQWLDDLFAPWMSDMCTSNTMINPGKISKSARIKYVAWQYTMAEAEVEELEPLQIERRQILSYGQGEFVLPVASIEDAKALLVNALPKWTKLDLSAVLLPEIYPPPLPVFDSIHLEPLTDAMTDIFCRIHFGDHIQCQNGYRIVGQRLYRLAASKLAINNLPSATAAELDDARCECTNPALIARLGLVLNLHRHVRLLRRVKENAPQASVANCEDSFYALLGVMHLQLGWDSLIEWLDKLLSPWIVAAGNGTFRVSPLTQKKRDNRLERYNKGMLKAEIASKPPCEVISDVLDTANAGPQQRYSTTVPKQRRKRHRIARASD
ncbi:hypothetical protein B0H19DRAFT_1241949 [Mycena capillaripes]|nr:hypothetical protein B0H19DRAFT_1241949 [Mycena capillaripes]